MKNLYNQSDVSGILARIEQLTPNSERQWGTMNVAQMLAHCNISIGTPLGLNFPKRMFLGRIVGGFIKPKVLGEQILDKNTPTVKNYEVTSSCNFEAEKTKAVALIQQFVEGGTAKCSTHPHAFFGKLTPEEWAILQWKHYDHHLRQFGV